VKIRLRWTQSNWPKISFKTRNMTRRSVRGGLGTGSLVVPSRSQAALADDQLTDRQKKPGRSDAAGRHVAVDGLSLRQAGNVCSGAEAFARCGLTLTSQKNPKSQPMRDQQ